MERKFIRHRNAREVKISGSSNPRARVRDRIICFGIDDGPKMVRGKGPKIDAMPGMRAAGSATCFISTALRPRYYRRQFFKPRHTAVVRHFRLTGVSRASGEKRPNCASTRPCFTTANRGAPYFRVRFAARKMCHRASRLSQFSKKKNHILVNARETRWEKARTNERAVAVAAAAATTAAAMIVFSTCKSVCA